MRRTYAGISERPIQAECFGRMSCRIVSALLATVWHTPLDSMLSNAS